MLIVQIRILWLVTFKDLQKLVQSQQSEPGDNQLLQRLRDNLFWIWDRERHKPESMKTKEERCFYHMI
jgi:hypothetical protein